MPNDPLRDLLTRWRHDPGATYRTWFTWDEVAHPTCALPFDRAGPRLLAWAEDDA